MKILILGDSHDSLWPDFFQHLKDRGAERILHLGDVCSRQVLNRFEEIAPVLAVRGNNDGSLRDLPAERLFRLEGVCFYMIHDRRKARRKPEEYDLMLFGHTHRFEEGIRRDRPYLNPGSCGRRRADDSVSYVEMEIAGGVYQYRHRTFTPESTLRPS